MATAIYLESDAIFVVDFPIIMHSGSIITLKTCVLRSFCSTKHVVRIGSILRGFLANLSFASVDLITKNTRYSIETKYFHWGVEVSTLYYSAVLAYVSSSLIRRKCASFRKCNEIAWS